MSRVLSVAEERFPIAGAFTISRGTKTEAVVMTCSIAQSGRIGRGECVPYARYGETPQSVRAQIEAAADAISGGVDRLHLLSLMKPGAARNAVDCALWDLEAKLAGKSVAERVCSEPPVALETAYTLSLGSPEAMAAQARDNAERPLLKVKIGGEGDIARIRAVVEAAPDSRIILDANEAWTERNLRENLAASRWSNSRCRPAPIRCWPESITPCRSARTRAYTGPTTWRGSRDSMMRSTSSSTRRAG